jgi:8-oxo-dGTP diphosphatase/putative hydrolase of the HAD superfamily
LNISIHIIPAKEIGMKTIWIKQGFGKYFNRNVKERETINVS